MSPLSLQELYAPNSICFGCGPANVQGLRIRSFVRDAEVVATWQAASHHQAFPGMLNGGILGALLDCHSNWTAAWFIMHRDGLPAPLCTVTADYAVKLLRPTPAGSTLDLSAKVVASTKDRATVEAVIFAEGKVRATCTGTFVAVAPGHPAYHRWGQ